MHTPPSRERPDPAWVHEVEQLDQRIGALEMLLTIVLGPAEIVAEIGLLRARIDVLLAMLPAPTLH